MFDQFREEWAVDFEYLAPDGEHPEPVCLVAIDLRTGRTIRLRREEMGASPPYDISRNSLFVSFASDAEMECHLTLGWPLPARVLDLRIEWMWATNSTPPLPPEIDPKTKKKTRTSLARVMRYYGLDEIDTVEKEQMRELILRGGSHTAAEWEEILDYCETDVRALQQLLPVMIRRGHIRPDSLNHGRYMRAVTRMQFTGVPLNLERFDRLASQWDAVRMRLIETLGKQYGVFDEGGSFSQKRFVRYLNDRGWGWPTHESGSLDLRDKTFKDMAQRHPELEPLRQLKYCLEKLKLRDLAVGRDGFNRCWLNPYGSRTSRNQPSNSRFIFGPAVWLRDFLIQAKIGSAIIYLDWIAQEFAIAAALSGDQLMKDAYASGEDVYFVLGQQMGIIPREATLETHGLQRDQCKICVLATNYGQSYQALAEQINQPDIVGREFLHRHHRIYHQYWAWSDNRINRSALYNEQATIFGWRHLFKEQPKATSARNFFMQANGAEMLRLACCLGTEAGISICAPVHDAILMMAPLDRLEEDVARMRGFMAQASETTLGGFRLRTDQHIFKHPEHYSDPKGRGQFMLKTVMKLL